MHRHHRNEAIGVVVGEIEDILVGRVELGEVQVRLARRRVVLVEGEEQEATAVVPHEAGPDESGPSVTWVFPRDGAADLTPTSKIGVTFSEMVDVKSAWEGSVRLWDSERGPEEGRVAGLISTQENIVSFVPRCPLTPGREYTFEIPAGGVSDFSGNATAETFQATFRVAGGS